MEVFIGACDALVQVVAHPFASRHASGHDLQGLRKKYFAMLNASYGMIWLRLLAVA
jgi:hypothetical protein